MADPFQFEGTLSEYSRTELETALAGAYVIAEQAGEKIREREARIAKLEAAAQDIIDLVGHGRAHVRNGRAVRECVLPEEAVARLRKVLDR